MSQPIPDLKSILRLASASVEQAETQIHDKDMQIVYLSDKLNKVFHALRQFHSHHGRDLDPDVLDAFNAAWRSQEASFDTWQSYQKQSSICEHFNLTIDLD
jgi:hypothetical protein